MKKTTLLALGSIIMLSSILPAAALADYYPVSTTAAYGYGYNQACAAINYNLGYGTSGTDVTTLQQFLISKGYLQIAVPTGFFGRLTQNAVMRFQTISAIPVTGFADAVTRNAIQLSSCGSQPVAPPYYQNGNGYYPPAVPSIVPITASPVFISGLSASAAQIGTSITIYGTGFDPANNTVNFGGGIIAGLASYNGTSISFTVPQTMSPSCATPYVYGSQYAYGSQNCYNYGSAYNNTALTVQPGSYPISVMTSRGTSNPVSFTVTSYDNNCYSYNYYNCNNNNNYNYNYNTAGSPIISYLTPASGTTGTYVTIYGSNFTPTGNTVFFNSTAVQNISSYNGTSLSFTVPNACQNNYSYQYSCSNNNSQYLANGTYNVYVTNASGYSSNTLQFTFTSNGNYYEGNTGTINLNYLSPMQGYVGTQIMLQGSGFSSYGNTIHFGNGGIENVSSNGSTLYFTIPTTLNPCQVSIAGGCQTYAQTVTAGSYPVYVTNTSGQTSNTLYFTVLQ